MREMGGSTLGDERQSYREGEKERETEGSTLRETELQRGRGKESEMGGSAL